MYEVVMAEFFSFDLLAVRCYSVQLGNDVCLMLRMVCRVWLVSSRGMWNDLTYVTSMDKTKMVICRRIKDSWYVWPLRRWEIPIGRIITLLKTYVFLILVYVEETSRRLMCIDSCLFKMNS